MSEKKFHTIDLKEVSDDGEFEGYASVFGVVDQGDDIVERGAFRRSIAEKGPSRIKLLWQHNSSEPIGMWKEMREDEKGLYVKGKLLQTITRAKETLELMRAGIIDGLSIGFRTIKSARDETTGIRRLLEVDLWEISVVTFPMLPVANITGVKATDLTIRDVERILREAGVPNSFAKAVATHGYDEAKRRMSEGQREADSGLNELLESLQGATQLMKGN